MSQNRRTSAPSQPTQPREAKAEAPRGACAVRPGGGPHAHVHRRDADHRLRTSPPLGKTPGLRVPPDTPSGAGRSALSLAVAGFSQAVGVATVASGLAVPRGGCPLFLARCPQGGWAGCCRGQRAGTGPPTPARLTSGFGRGAVTLEGRGAALLPQKTALSPRTSKRRTLIQGP